MKSNKKYKRTEYGNQEQAGVSHFHELDLSGTYSYANYLKWHFDERVELIRGKIFPINAPSLSHQRILLRLAIIFNGLIAEKKCCEVFIAPFDVRLPGKDIEDTAVYTVVQPDLCVICDPSYLDEKGCSGLPDLIVEILSPSSLRNDLKIKRELYAEVGVREYLVVDPNRKNILKFLRNEMGVYVQEVFSGKQVCSSALFPSLSLIPETLFNTT
jgi:Uma2 family endonuclease